MQRPDAGLRTVLIQSVICRWLSPDTVPLLRQLASLYLRASLRLARAARPVPDAAISRICLFCALGDLENPHYRPGLGDMILKSAFLKVLATRYPAAHISLVAGPGLIAGFGPFLLRHSYIKELIECPEVGQGGVRDWYRFLNEVRARRFELCIIDPFSVTTRALHAYWCGIPRRIAAATGSAEDRFATSLVTMHFAERGAPDLLDFTSAFARAIGIEAGNGGQVFTPRLRYVAKNALRLTVPRPIVAVHVGGDRSWNRRWPLASFQELCLRLCVDAGASVWLVGGGDDSVECEIVLQHVRRRRPGASIRNLSGVDVNDTLNYLSQATLFVGNDSAPMHMAAALGVPVVVLVGPVDSRLWERMYEARTVSAGASCHSIDAHPRRYYERQINCLTWRCPYAFDPQRPVYLRCMQDITVEQTWQVVADCLRNASDESGDTATRNG